VVGNLSVGGAAGADPKPAVPGKLDQWDLLPSINLIYKLKDDELAPANLRVNYFRSIGRPSFREFSVVQLYDYILNAPVFGNPELELTAIDNYDLRLERFFKDRSNVSLSVFYKEFRNHIELLSTIGGGFTWRNASRSRVYGLELEGRIMLSKNLDWRGNLTLMESASDLSFNLTGETVKYTTAMFGQAPYIVNSMITYSADSIRFFASVSYNVQGPRLVVANSELAPDAVSAYEMPRHIVDVTLNKYVAKHWGIRVRVRNLLNASQVRAYKFNSGYDVDFDRYTYGTEYQLTLSYTIK
jgi:outer membrane receptor protein involved in Fe transport